MNKAFLVGNLTRDPELKKTPNGVSVCTFSLAVNRRFANAAGERETDFLNIVTWRGLADNCAKYLEKGRSVAVVGEIRTRNYENQQGAKVYVTEIHADDVQFLAKGQGGGSGERSAAPAPAADAFPDSASDFAPLEDDELPF